MDTRAEFEIYLQLLMQVVSVRGGDPKAAAAEYVMPQSSGQVTALAEPLGGGAIPSTPAPSVPTKTPNVAAPPPVIAPAHQADALPKPNTLMPPPRPTTVAPPKSKS